MACSAPQSRKNPFGSKAPGIQNDRYKSDPRDDHSCDYGAAGRPDKIRRGCVDHGVPYVAREGDSEERNSDAAQKNNDVAATRANADMQTVMRKSNADRLAK